MAKLVGLISTVDDPATIKRRLDAMVEAVKHAPGTDEQRVPLPHGGLAFVGNRASTDSYCVWDETQSRLLAFHGQLVGHGVPKDGALDGSSREEEARGVRLLLSAIRDDPAKALRDLNGVFCIAYFDLPAGSAVLASDRYGLMPLYYSCDSRSFAFASEAKAVLRGAGVRELDWEACADFFYIGHMIGERTLFRGIRALGPAEVVTCRKGQLSVSKYEDFTTTPVLSEAEVSASKVASLFVESVRRMLRPGKANTLLLSGGFDSRLILGAMNRLGVNPRIMSLEHPTGPSRGEDARCAMRIAESLGLAYDYRRVQRPFFSSAESLESFYILDGMVPTWSVLIGALYAELDEAFGAVWDGMGLDVALGASHIVAGDVETNVRQFTSSRTRARPLLRSALNPDVFNALDATFPNRLQDELDSIPPSANRFSYFLFKNRTRRRIAVNPYQLYASKIEPVTPAADRNFLDYALAIPTSMKLNHRLYIDVLKTQFPALTKAPLVSGGAPFDFNSEELPEGSSTNSSAMRRARSSLGPLVERVRARRRRPWPENASLVVKILEKTGFDRPIYRRSQLGKLFARYREGDPSYSRLFDLVFYLELWNQLFIEDQPPTFFM